MTLPRPGDVLHLTASASVQFGSPILFRVIHVLDWPTYDGWIWISGYQLDQHGDAVERRSIFVQIAGLKYIVKTPDPRTRNTKAAVPKPRKSTLPRRKEAGQVDR